MLNLYSQLMENNIIHMSVWNKKKFIHTHLQQTNFSKYKSTKIIINGFGNSKFGYNPLNNKKNSKRPTVFG